MNLYLELDLQQSTEASKHDRPLEKDDPSRSRFGVRGLQSQLSVVVLMGSNGSVMMLD